MASVLSYLAATFAVALGGLCALCFAAWLRGLRPRLPAWLWRERNPWERAVLAAMLCAAVHVGSTKESGGTNSVPQMLPPGGGGMAGLLNHGNGILGNPMIPQYSTPAIQGSCDFSVPSNAVVCSDWLAFGGFEDWTHVPSGSWSFRFGTNFVERLVAFSSGEIAPFAAAASNRISLLGTPLSIAPAANWNLLPEGRESLFWHSETPSNTLLLTWRNALLLRDASRPVGVQAELHPDGAIDLRYDFSALPDLAALSNAAAAVCRDGAAEAVCLQTGLVAAVTFPAPDMPETDGLEDVFPRIELGNSNAYYFAEVSVAKGPSVVRVCGDGASDLGGYSFVANMGETNAIPLLIGVRYRISSEAAFSSLVPSSPSAVASNVTDRLVEVEWPVEFSLQKIGETEAETTYRLAVSPDFLGGVVTWAGAAPPMRGGAPPAGGACSCGCSTFSNDTVTASKSCQCVTCPVEGEYEYEGHSEPFSLDLKDPALDGGNSGGNDPDPENPDPGESGDGPSLSISFSKPVVLVEDAYESSPGVTHSRRSTETTLRIELTGNSYGGMLSLSSQNLDRLENATGGSVQLDSVVYLSPEATYSREYVCKGVSASAAVGDVVVSGSFTENLPGTISPGLPASATVVHVKVKAQETAPQNDCWQRHDYGVCERVVLQHAPLAAGVSWSVSGGGSVVDVNNSQYKMLICPSVGGGVSALAAGGGAELAIPLTIVEPQSIVATNVTWVDNNVATGLAGQVTMRIEQKVLPLNVSFTHVAIEEVPCDTGSHSGYFADLSMTNNWSHTYSRGAGLWVKVVGNNVLQNQDRVSCGACPPPWANGTLIWDIPFGWAELDADGSTPPIGTPPIKEFGTGVHHVITINPTGAVTVMKLGHWIMRSVFDEIVLDGVVVKEGAQ